MTCLARDPDPCEPLYSLPNKSAKAHRCGNQLWGTVPTLWNCYWQTNQTQECRGQLPGVKNSTEIGACPASCCCARTTIPTCSEAHTPNTHTEQMPAHPHPQGDCLLLQPAVQKKKICWYHLGVTWAFSTCNGVTPGSGFRSPNSEELKVSWSSRWLSLEEWLSN